MSAWKCFVSVSMLVMRGVSRNMSLLKTRVPGEKFPSELVGVQHNACIEVAMASSTSLLALSSLVGG